uniref:Wsv321-like protein n=1 Tax=Metapenaeus ensis nimavirus TaxID=2133794 RepID=A0A401IPE5_9VIRU|nr:MAG: wsv321-like protein [Metapenaeus ensis nimavirus]GBG35489.1 wsv321-like protein [Metapenaeus ensis nimavirus]
MGNMRFIAVLMLVALAAIITAVLFTNHSNYLTNINPSLDLTRRLGLKGTFTPEDIKDNNGILRDSLNSCVKLKIILEEIKKYNKSLDKSE